MQVRFLPCAYNKTKKVNILKIIKRKIGEILPQIKSAFDILSSWVRNDKKSYEDENGDFRVNWKSVSNAQERIEKALNKLEWLNEYINELEFNET